MRLTWKDAITTVVAGAIVAIYVAFLQGADLWLVSDVRGAVGAILVLGLAGGCALGAADELYTEKRSAATRTFTAVASLLGATALVAGVVGLITAGEVALAVLFYATIALWFISTLRHLLSVPSEPVLSRDTHEVIDQKKTARS